MCINWFVAQLRITSTRISEMAAASGREPEAEDGTIYNYDVETIDGEPAKVGDYARGKVTLVVNVASKCGFTNQYKDLQETYDTYKDRGFTILAFPCNQFGGVRCECMMYVRWRKFCSDARLTLIRHRYS